MFTSNEPRLVYIRELDGKEIVQIASGQQHSLALDSTGVVYVWGYNGYCRLGLGNQVDILKPKAVPQV
jgi:alpha-tubulin suppressor-like RCC1 family protein